MVENKSSKVQKTNSLTQIEQDILFYLTKEYLTVKHIAIRLKTSDKYIYKIRAKLLKKGLINRHYRLVEKTGNTIQPKPDRLHGQQFHINIIYADERYKNKLSKCNTVDIDGNTIMLYRNNIEIYSNTSFYAENEHKATWKSLKYWNRIITKIENDFNIILVKNRNQNIKLVQQHYGDINNEIAKGMNNSCEKIRIYADEDGKLCFMIDNSFNSNEAETTHPQTAKQDMTQWHKHINDWRLNKPPTLSELTTTIYLLTEKVNEIAKNNNETAIGLNNITKVLELLIPKQQEINKDTKLTNYIN